MPPRQNIVLMAASPSNFQILELASQTNFEIVYSHYYQMDYNHDQYMCRCACMLKFESTSSASSYYTGQ